MHNMMLIIVIYTYSLGGRGPKNTIPNVSKSVSQADNQLHSIIQ
jgi:hypothetical protein